MATKFTLQPKPTFKANVSIPRAGDEDGVLTFTFNHKPLKELADLEKLEGKTATDFLMEIIAGWALPDAFNAENLSVLLENYPAAMKAIPEVEKVFPDAVKSYGKTTLRDGSEIEDVKSVDTFGVAAALHHEAILALMDEVSCIKRLIKELDVGALD